MPSYPTRQEEIFLIAIWKLDQEAYGVKIRKKVKELSDKEISYGALYFTLDQIHKKGYVTRTQGDPTPVRGGCSKIFYTLTREGKNALQAAHSLQKNLWDGVSIITFK